MIKSFKHKGLKKLFETGDCSGVRPDHVKRLRLVLNLLNEVSDISEMNFPGSCLHKLTGKLAGQYSVKVNGNWRVFFKFENGDAYIVNYDDYH